VSGYGAHIFPLHAALLADSAISPEVARQRRYVSVDVKKRLEEVGFERYQRTVPGLLIPLRRADGSVWGYQYRHDEPRQTRAGTKVRYDSPKGQRNGIDVPVAIKDMLGDPSVPLLVTEGSRKADSAVTAGLACVSMAGVWGWRGRNAKGGKLAVADWHDIALNGRRVVLAFDSDVTTKRKVQQTLAELAGYLETKDAKVEYLHLPDDGDGKKTGLDDYIEANGADGLWELVRPNLPAVQAMLPPARSVPEAAPAQHAPAWDGDPAEVFDEVAAWIGRYLSVPSEHCITVLALWAAHTHATGVFYVTPRLILDSAEPESGKTRVLELLNLIVRAPIFTMNTTIAALYRRLDGDPRTILLDEADAVFAKGAAQNHEDLRALLNAGYKRGATVDRCVGDGASMTVKEFPVFAPVALAGIAGNMPPTITTRAITVHMRRRAPDEDIAEFIEEDAIGEATPLRQALADWMGSAADSELKGSRPAMPAGVADRKAEVWRALLAVADAAGDDWPDRAREACRHFVLATDPGELSLGVRLLADLREVFGEHDVMPTTVILDKLKAIEDGPWADMHGKEIDARRLSRMLGKYQVKPKVVRVGDSTPRGYSREQLADLWRRYLDPPVSATSATSATPLASHVADVADVAHTPRACAVCGDPLDPVLAAAGYHTHPACDPDEGAAP
jgi:Protein of unknown function (DUF3631)/Domain of unknown function (DUF3854)